MPKIKGIDKRLDEAWSKLVKLEANNACEYCGKTTTLNSHHIFSRSNRSVRWDETNGVCLCVAHHTFGNWSAHKSPVEFIYWLEEEYGKEYLEDLRYRANQTKKWTKAEKEEHLIYLLDKIAKYESNG